VSVCSFLATSQWFCWLTSATFYGIVLIPFEIPWTCRHDDWWLPQYCIRIRSSLACSSWWSSSSDWTKWMRYLWTRESGGTYSRCNRISWVSPAWTDGSQPSPPQCNDTFQSAASSRSQAAFLSYPSSNSYWYSQPEIHTIFYRYPVSLWLKQGAKWRLRSDSLDESIAYCA